jgi:hypothetical protein
MRPYAGYKAKLLVHKLRVEYCAGDVEIGNIEMVSTYRENI